MFHEETSALERGLMNLRGAAVPGDTRRGFRVGRGGVGKPTLPTPQARNPERFRDEELCCIDVGI